MIPVPANHSPDIINRDQFPRFISNVLPPRDFFQHQQAHFIASIQEMPRLRVVRCADDVALQVFAQDSRVIALRPSRHRLPDERKRLMPVQPA